MRAGLAGKGVLVFELAVISAGAANDAALAR
jgi:hypothetical protein